MKQVAFILVLIVLVSCEKKTEKTCPTAKVVEITCAGSVLQFIGENESFGEEWNDFYETPDSTYTNCALAENLPSDEYSKGDTIYLNYVQVMRFTTVGLCELSGLPKTKIRITEILDGDCN